MSTKKDLFITQYIHNMELGQIDGDTLEEAIKAYDQHIENERDRHPRRSKMMNKDIFVGLVARNPARSIDYLARLLQADKDNRSFFTYLNAIAHPDSLDDLYAMVIPCIVGQVFYGADKFMLTSNRSSFTFCIPLYCNINDVETAQEYCIQRELDADIYHDGHILRAGVHEAYSLSRQLINLPYPDFYKLFCTPVDEDHHYRLCIIYDLLGTARHYRVITIRGKIDYDSLGSERM
jgi:hypothetical protein